MFSRENTTIVIQGNIYSSWTKDFAIKYKQYFDNVIVSTWINEDISFKDNDITIVKNISPVEPGTGNINKQIISSFQGLENVNTEYSIKVRSDILIEEPKKWLDFFTRYYEKERIFVLGLSNRYPFSPRDQIFAGKTEMMKMLFDIKLIKDSNYEFTIRNFYPEVYIGLSYYANFNNRIKELLYNSNQNISNISNSNEIMDIWKDIRFKYMYPVSRTLKYSWPKRFVNQYYNYDETSINSGEFWHEDIIK